MYMKKIEQCHQTISNKEERKVATRNCHRSITNPRSWRCLVSLHDLAAAHSPLHHSDAHLLTSQQISDNNWHNEDHTTVTIWTSITSSVWWKCPKTVKCRVWMTLQKHHYLKDTDLLTQAWSMGVLEGHHNFYTHECMTCLQCFDAVGWATGRPSGLWKTEWWGAGMAICLERGADLHMAQLMPLPLTVSCFSKIQTGFTFLVLAHPGGHGKWAIKRVRVWEHDKFYKTVPTSAEFRLAFLHSRNQKETQNS